MIGPQEAHYIAAGVLAVYAGYRIFMLLTHETVQKVTADILREFGLWAFVFAVVMNYQPLLDNMQAYTSNIYSVVNETYTRIVKMAYCSANLGLSGPLAPYSAVASAKFSIYQSVYYNVLNTYSQIFGASQLLLNYGYVLLAVGFLLYAAWLRPVGGAILGVFLGVLIGVALLGSWAPSQINQLAPELQKTTWYPFQAAAVHCDDQLVSMFQQDLHKYAEIAYVGIFAMIAAVAAGGAVGFVLGRF